jgi:hypothetical protein
VRYAHPGRATSKESESVVEFVLVLPLMLVLR